MYGVYTRYRIWRSLSLSLSPVPQTPRTAGARARARSFGTVGTHATTELVPPAGNEKEREKPSASITFVRVVCCSIREYAITRRE